MSGYPLYDPRWEHDACGTGFVANVAGKKSYDIVRKAITSVCNLTHRGAVSADTQTGDGAGILTQLPLKFFLEEVQGLSSRLESEDELGVGMLFMPKANSDAYALCKTLVEYAISRRGLGLIGWREVPVDIRVIGESAALTAPYIQQVLMKKPRHCSADQFEWRLYLVRKEIEKHVLQTDIKDFYIASFSSRTIVYKGLMIATALDKFYPDLKKQSFESSLAIYHQRYSTNTFPTWNLAQPFRMLAHNGEINTIQGNRIWTQAREAEIPAEVQGEDVGVLKPLIQPRGSDSANLDNVLEAMTLTGRPVLHSMMMLVPESWRARNDLDEQVQDFYEYCSGFCEPWDGPAALIFSDGITVGASLDRNGLRPARYKLTVDGLFVLGSEVGALEIDDALVIEKGKLGPGQMIAIDTARGLLLRDLEIKKEIAARKPYSEWVKANLTTVPKAASDEITPSSPDDLVRRQLCFGYSVDELTMLLKPMAEGGKEPVGSMGDDAPLSVLSKLPKLLPTYFRQQFAQVTNPPIDPIRERLVMSLGSKLGYRRNWFTETPEHAKQVLLETPVMYNSELEKIRTFTDPAFQATTISILFNASEGESGMEKSLETICRQAERAANEGKYVIILSDRGVDAEHAPLPIMLAVGAVHNHLLKANKRLKLSIVAETGEPRDVHHFAALIGYGANAVNPYLAFETLRAMVDAGELGDVTAEKAMNNFRKAIEDGLLKVISKMGISVLGSYRGAQIFEAIGISREIVDRFFTNTPSRIGGIGLKEIAHDTLERHRHGFETEECELVDEGHFRIRKNGERHAWSAEALRAMQKLRKSEGFEEYDHLRKALNDVAPIGIKDLLEFKKVNSPIPIEEVEPVEDIRCRFTTAAMSLGSISPETHETIAIAMNRIGGRSNSGEGGEDPRRSRILSNGDSANSAIKQVASGRFGVTAEFLSSAKEIEIKMAQGSKPGEGGQIPGDKVSPLVAKLRRVIPGMPLISPPPHHDIYSIEDLAQLIYDLKQANPRARVCVKLVSEAGVGTIAAGVAKAYADVILVSGSNGGTGASPLSSIKNAGGPWELGIAETQQVLVMNGLRERVTLRADGGMRTGRDIVIAAMLGAEEFNFGTATLISLGCRYVRQCHLNTCPVGVATQDERLRKRFDGKPEELIKYFTAVSEEIRQILASLGFRSLNELIGRTDLLQQKTITDHQRANTVDLSGILARRDYENEQRYRVWHRNDKPGSPLDDIILQDVKDAIRERVPITVKYKIKNVHRSVGTKLSGEIAYLYGDRGLPENTIELRFSGSAGQSFGAFLVQGIKMVLDGEANDYVGKGMCGGEIIIRPTRQGTSTAEDVIIGNTVLYGATGGALFACGRAGERFAVRNSGSLAVVESVGDHGCEYMTNGTVVVLGGTGRNFGAGMTGGSAYVLDIQGGFEKNFNPELIAISRIDHADDIQFLQSIISKHMNLTYSIRAQKILMNWSDYLPLFWKIVPKYIPPAISEPGSEVHRKAIIHSHSQVTPA